MTMHPLVARYIDRLSAGLDGLAPSDRQEVVNEITNHIDDATAAGKSLDAVLETLGDADALARAYKVELLLHPRQAETSRPAGIERWFRLAALVVVGSLPTFIIVVVLGSVGISLLFAGVVVFGAGILAPMNVFPTEALDVEPWFAVASGPVIAAAGVFVLFLLGKYIRAAARIVRRVLPRQPS